MAVFQHIQESEDRDYLMAKSLIFNFQAIFNAPNYTKLKF